MGYIYTPEGKKVDLFNDEGIETLGRLVESNADSPNERFYGDLIIFARHLLGYSYFPLDQYKIAPSALEHFETSLRDPMFWQMYKRILYYYFTHQNYEGPYEPKELFFNGVKVDDIIVDRLVTYFDYFYSDLSNAVVVDEKEFQTDSVDIHARQYRLNHKPFHYKIAVTADKPVDTLVKVFIGPKYDEFGREIDIDDNRYNFFELERFQYSLVAGKNVIERDSHENDYFSYDRFTYTDLVDKVEAGINGQEFKIYDWFRYYGMPNRFMLPKGDFGGKTYQFYVIVCPFQGKSVDKYLIDSEEYSIGYPFDRPIEFEHEFFVPNSYFKDVMIYHKNIDEEIETMWSNH